MAFAHIVYPTTFVLYADYRFGWGSRMAGYTLALVGVLSVIVQGGLIKKIIARLGERRAMLFGLGCGVVGFMLYAPRADRLLVLGDDAHRGAVGVAQPSAQAMMTQARSTRVSRGCDCRVPSRVCRARQWLSARSLSRAFLPQSRRRSDTMHWLQRHSGLRR